MSWVMMEELGMSHGGCWVGGGGSKRWAQLAQAGGFLLTLVHGKQRSNGALVPHGDEQCPGKNYQHDSQDVSTLRHLQG